MLARAPASAINLRPFQAVGQLALLLAFLALLRLPSPYRDILFLGALLASIFLAVGNFTVVWTTWLGLLPGVVLVSSLLGEPKIDGTRLLLASMILVLALLRKGPAFWTTILRPLGPLAFLLFVAANLISAARLPDLEAVARSLTYLEPLFVFFLTYYAVQQRPEGLKRLLSVFVVSALFVGLLGLAEIAWQRSILDVLGIHNPFLVSDFFMRNVYFLDDRFGLGGRISSIIGQPVYAAITFVVYFTVLVFRSTAHASGKKSLAVAWLALGALLLLGTGARGPLLALFPAAFIFVILTSRRSVAQLIAVAALFISGLLLYLLLPQLQVFLVRSFSQMFTPESANVIGRLNLTQTLLGIFHENPILGFGPGLIQKLAFRGVPGYSDLAGLENQYAVILADGGLLAGVTYLLFMVGVLHHLRTMLRTSQDSVVQQMSNLVLFLFVYYFIVTSTVTAVTQLCFYLIMALYGATAGRYDLEGIPDGWSYPKETVFGRQNRCAESPEHLRIER